MTKVFKSFAELRDFVKDKYDEANDTFKNFEKKKPSKKGYPRYE